MGNKGGRENLASHTSLNPSERRRLTHFLDSKGSSTQLNHNSMNNLWKELLVPDLLKRYADFLMEQDHSKKNFIGVDEFVFIYTSLVRGNSEEVAMSLAALTGVGKNSSGEHITSFSDLCKYFSDLLESYFLGQRHSNDVNYKTWTYSRHPERGVIVEVIKGVCVDLPRNNDEVKVHDLERWINYAGFISVLHSHVLGSLYNLEPEVKASVVPLAMLPTSRTATFLDLSQVVYLNSFLPTENKTSWRFIFSTTTHGESFSKLVGCIMNQGPVLIIIKSDDESIFGGFIADNLILGPRWVGGDDCFLFKLRPSVEVFPATGYNDHHAYMNMNQSSLPNGIGMGGQYNYWGLWVDSHFGVGECSESCTTYKNYSMLSSQKQFRINQLEVWAVGKPPATDEEKGERSAKSTRSVLDVDATATHIMEMAGQHTFRGKQFRERKPSTSSQN